MIVRILLAAALPLILISTMVFDANAQDAAALGTDAASNAPASAPASAPAEAPSLPAGDAAVAEAPASDSQSDAPINAPGDLPVDEDAATRDARIRDLLSLVKDNTLHINKRENPAYYALVKRVLEQSDDQLREAITQNPRFDNLYQKPDQYRGELIHVSLNVRRILPIEVKVRNAANVTKLYELWGWTEEAKAHMYCCIVPELPAGFPEEGDFAKLVELTGYFFKLQAYQPGNQAPNARNLVAPLVIGRIVDAGPVIKPGPQSIGNWPILMIVGFSVIIMFRLMMHLRGMGRNTPTHRNYRRRSLEPIDPDALADGLPETERGLRIRNANEL